MLVLLEVEVVIVVIDALAIIVTVALDSVATRIMSRAAAVRTLAGVCLEVASDAVVLFHVGSPLVG
jgi:hypothetical protein